MKNSTREKYRTDGWDDDAIVSSSILPEEKKKRREEGEKEFLARTHSRSADCLRCSFQSDFDRFICYAVWQEKTEKEKKNDSSIEQNEKISRQHVFFFSSKEKNNESSMSLLIEC